ncbi:hypothetical protein BD410DRAFT_806345 [Rickenella mellea]|uniref:Uncharacterized protein n=1 Tax=Rickenella mellea TaxID=50990 RepID=A0A4Y7PVK3_9AGAM|nr:hypothetical protein BD410DRAFT_806345 [Rickenella mellea]
MKWLARRRDIRQTDTGRTLNTQQQSAIGAWRVRVNAKCHKNITPPIAMSMNESTMFVAKPGERKRAGKITSEVDEEEIRRDQMFSCWSSCGLRLHTSASGSGSGLVSHGSRYTCDFTDLWEQIQVIILKKVLGLDLLTADVNMGPSSGGSDYRRGRSESTTVSHKEITTDGHDLEDVGMARPLLMAMAMAEADLLRMLVPNQQRIA